MRKNLFFVGLVFVGLAFVVGNRLGQVRAGVCSSTQVCYGSRTLTEHVCQGGNQVCSVWCNEWSCSNFPSVSCSGTGDNEPCYDHTTPSNSGTCVRPCCVYGDSSQSCAGYDEITVDCDLDGNDCHATGSRYTCEEDLTNCTDYPVSNEGYGCCGPGGGSDPDPTHKECNASDECVTVAGEGVNECSTNAACEPVPPTDPYCDISLFPSPASVDSGSSIPLTVSINSEGNGSINEVRFLSNNLPVATVVWSDTTRSFGTTLTGVAPGNATITARAFMGGVWTCTTTAPVSVPSYTISGTVHLDPTCSGVSNPIEPGSGAEIYNSTLLSADINASGQYSYSGVEAGGYVLTLQNMDSEYTCCGSCDAAATVNSTNGNAVVDFYINNQRNPWWQTVGGDIGANGGYVSSNIPDTCIAPVCYPYLTRLNQNYADPTDSTGVLTYASGTNSWNFPSGTLSEDGRNYVANAVIPTDRGFEGYDYFYRKFELGPTPNDDFATKTGVNKPTFDSGRAYEDGTRVYFSNGDLLLNDQQWDVASGEKIVVFVKGDVDIRSKIITDSGGFIAFIASGDIRFYQGYQSAEYSSEVGYDQGVFIADGSISTVSGPLGNTYKFVGEGIFIGWNETPGNIVPSGGGVVLNRDFESLDNNTIPAELFIYRPDFVFNAPDAMKSPVLRWEEVAP